MSGIIVAILISPCISMAAVDKDNNTTELSVCPNTVKIEQRIVIKQLAYALHQKNYFKLRKVLIDNKDKPVLQ